MYDVYLSMRHTPLSMYYAGWFEKCFGSYEVRTHNGFDRIRCGTFPEDLVRQIKASKNFIVILTPETFGKGDDNENWMAYEIEIALKEKINIIPVLSSDFIWPEKLPERICKIKDYKEVVVSSGDYYSMASDLLKNSIKEIVRRLLPNDKQEKVFISYSTKDYRIAEEIRCFLEKRHNIDCWMAPSSIPAGGDYGKSIPDAIRKCEIFLLVLSENSQNSNWVPREVGIAIKERKTIIPIRIDESEITPEFELFLINCQIIPADDDLDGAFFALAESIYDTIS